jgi:hypothetical protein
MGLTALPVTSPPPSYLGHAVQNEGIPGTFTAGGGTNQMTVFREFVSSVHYPPNPEQPKNRVYSGSMFGPGVTPGSSQAAIDAQSTSAAQGSLALRGMKLFHMRDYIDDSNEDGSQITSTSCVSCHVLPEGSDNLLTDFAFEFSDDASLPLQNIETGQLRGAFEKDKRLYRRNTSGQFVPVPTPSSVPPAFPTPASVVSGNVGMIHTGSATTVVVANADSVLGFVGNFAVPNSPPVVTTPNPALFGAGDVADVALYVFELDNGVAPSIGICGTADATTSTILVNAALTAWEAFADSGNSGLVLRIRVGGVMYGLYYDVAASIVAGAPTYREVPPDSTVTNPAPLTAGTPVARTTLTALLTGTNRLFAECVPLGSERRIAYVHAGTMPGETPVTPVTAPLLRPMMTNTANRLLPLMNANFAGFMGGILNGWSPHRAAALFQTSIIGNAVAPAPAGTPARFGLSATQRFDAPRRLRVSGSELQHGAAIRLTLAMPADIATATTTTPPTAAPNPAVNFNTLLELPIYPTIDAQGVVTSQAVWETAVELNPELYYGIMNGVTSNLNAGVWIQDPAWNPATVVGPLPAPFNTVPAFPAPLTVTALLSPLLDNWVYVQIVNQPGSATPLVSPGSWQRLTVF